MILSAINVLENNNTITYIKVELSWDDLAEITTKGIVETAFIVLEGKIGFGYCIVNADLCRDWLCKTPPMTLCMINNNQLKQLISDGYIVLTYNSENIISITIIYLPTRVEMGRLMERLERQRSKHKGETE